MAAEASAYAVLGLDVDADWPSVEGAYKSLIKAHHPDRAGGDALRAAEINRAYRELRQARWPHDGDHEPLFDDEADPPPHEISRGWLAASLGLAGVAVLLVLLVTPVGTMVDDFRTRALRAGGLTSNHESRPAIVDPMSVPLDLGSVDGAVLDAVRMARMGNEAAMAEASRACHGRLHVQPSLAQLDRCAAFDDAVVQLQDRDPLGDDGPFGQVAITGRAMSGAALFSDDYVEIDARLRRIRRAVEQALAPPPLPPVTPPSN